MNGFWVVRAVDHQHGQAFAQGATGASSAPVKIALSPTASAGEVP
jgi:hypothetical protein